MYIKIRRSLKCECLVFVMMLLTFSFAVILLLYPLCYLFVP